jgi:hypothetical protein
MNTPILDGVLVRLCAAWVQRAVALSIAMIQAGHPPSPTNPAVP